MANVQFIKYKGKEILLGDHRGLSGDDLLNNFKRVNKAISEKGGNVLLLADLTDAFVSNEAMAYLKGSESKLVSRFIQKMAVVGISGMKKILLNAYNTIIGKEARAFNSIDEAKEYLTT